MLRYCLILPLALLYLPATTDVLEEGAVRVSYHERDKAAAEWSLDVVREALAEFGDELPPGDEPIHVIVAHTLNEFMQYAHRFSGLTVSGVAKSRQGLIVVKAPRLRKASGDFAGTLRHELVHVLLYRNADTGALPRWMNEGIAMSLANEYRWASMLKVARMFLENRIIEYRHLDRAFLAPGNEMEFNDAYAQALSMTRSLRDWVGEERFWNVVRGTSALSFPDALRRFGGMSTREFWQRYKRSLYKIALIGTLASGSFFTPAALLLIVAYIRRRAKDRKIIRRWEAEEAANADAPEIFSWDAVVEDPDAWKQGYDQDD